MCADHYHIMFGLRKMFVRLCIISLSLLTAACQQTGFMAANIGNWTGDYKAHKNIAYGDQPWQQLDVYVPENAASGTHPVVMFIYGGGWTMGKKGQYQFVANQLTQRGFIVVIPDYQKYPPATYPAFVKDAALAAKWLHTNIDHYGGDLTATHIMHGAFGGCAYGSHVDC